jgi:hypothetical protein
MFPRKINDLSLGARHLGLAMLTAALICGELAQAHMARLEAMCGFAGSHCGWCYAAALFAVTSGLTFGLAAHSAAWPRLAVKARSPRH